MPHALRSRIQSRYGSRGGYARHLRAKLEYKLSDWTGHAPSWMQTPDFSRVRRVIFVCKGNICRSAYAHARTLKRGWPAVDSAGLMASPDAPANEVARSSASKRNIDLSAHRSKHIETFSLSSNDLLIAFEPWQAKALAEIAQESDSQVILAGLLLRSPMPHIEDPYGLDEDYFDTCFSRIDDVVDRLVHELTGRIPYGVLVAEAESMGAVAVIRSLGRAGYRVHAIARGEIALGFESSYASSHSVCPPYSSPHFIDWLRNEIKTHEIRAIIPSEGFLIAIREHFEEFGALIPFRSKDTESLYKGLSKYDLFNATHPENLPPTLTLDLDLDLAEDNVRFLGVREKLETLGSPLYLKFDGLYARKGASGRVIKTSNASEALNALKDLRTAYSKVVVQGHVAGRGVGAFFCVWNGEIVADFMHLRLHEVPHTGGISALRVSYFHEAIYADARKRILDLGWQGPAMMEYRWNENTNEFYLMEMNGRFWGSLHLPIYAGVDFPAILMRCFNGESLPAVKPAAYRLGVYSRLAIPADVQYVRSLWTDRSVSVFKKVSALLEFAWLSVRPDVHSDLLSFPGDRALFFNEARLYLRQLRSLLNKRFRKTTPIR